jgi:hypothetical protein
MLYYDASRFFNPVCESLIKVACVNKPIADHVQKVLVVITEIF